MRLRMRDNFYTFVDKICRRIEIGSIKKLPVIRY